jgi:hypothetical protein
MVPCLSGGEGADSSEVIIAVVERTLAAMGTVVVVSAAAGADGPGEAMAQAGQVVEAGEDVLVLGVAGVKETEEAKETRDDEVLLGAGGKVDAIGARGAGEAIEVGDTVEARYVLRAVELIEYMEVGEVGGAVGDVKVGGIAAARATNSNMATVSAAEILAKIQL